jgi:phosphohistidine phosphatase SixA
MIGGRGNPMARDLILLRHAHAEPAARECPDFERRLSPTGRAEADAAGAWLHAHGAIPDRVLYSPAVRARETCTRALVALGRADCAAEPRIYEATPATLIDIVEAAAASSLLLVGHNPGLENLVALLSDGASDAGRGMPPAAIAWLRMPDGIVLEPGTAEIRHFWWP